MTTRIVKRKGKEYSLGYAMVGTNMQITLNGIHAEQIWYETSKKVWFAPFTLETGNFWVIVYNNRPYLATGGESMTEEDFKRDYLPNAFSPSATIGYFAFLLILPSVILGLIGSYLNPGIGSSDDAIMLVCGALIFLLMNITPVGSTKIRRKLANLSLIPHLISLLLIASNYLL